MDLLSSLSQSLSQVTAYDIKSKYNQAVNYMLNLTDMQIKVREATNEDTWGASSTLMREIADGTKNYQQFNEIMPMIFKRFTDTEARDWRQIYKALQLLEYLIKHGSEGVVDFVNGERRTIELLQSFHYIDEKGKDQGINVRARAKEISLLIGNPEQIKLERRKAKASRNKYIGTGSDAFAASGSRFGGSTSFGDSRSTTRGGDDFARYGANSSSRQAAGAASSNNFEEYDAGEWDDRTVRRNKPGATGADSSVRPSAGTASSQIATSAQPVVDKTSPPKAKVAEVDFFSFDDEPTPPVPPSASTKSKLTPAPAAPVGLDDDFDDFQSGPGSSNFVSPTPAKKSSLPTNTSTTTMKPDVFALLNAKSSGLTQPLTNSSSGMFPMQVQPIQPASVSVSIPPSNPVMAPNYISPITPNNNNSMIPPISGTTTSNSKPVSANDAFGDDLFSSFANMGVSSKNNKSVNGSGQGKTSMADMARQQSSATIWGNHSAGTSNRVVSGSGGSGGHVLMGSGAVQGGFGNGNDDLLL